MTFDKIDAVIGADNREAVMAAVREALRVGAKNASTAESTQAVRELLVAALAAVVRLGPGDAMLLADECALRLVAVVKQAENYSTHH